MQDDLIFYMAKAAKHAQRQLATMPRAVKDAALRAMAKAIRNHSSAIIAANAEDMKAGAAAGLSSAMLDRLMLDEGRMAGIADAVEAIAVLDDPVGEVFGQSEAPNGLKLHRVRIPIGVIGIIYESRPNVTADAAALCFKSGNAVILRGGSEAVHSNRAIHNALILGLMEEGFSPDLIQLVPSTDRALVGDMLRASGLIDMIVPRGGKSLVARVQEEARVPVLAHLDGINHIYVAADADPVKAAAVAVNAKLRRPGVCGAVETLLIDRAYPEAAALIVALLDAGAEVRGDEATIAFDSRVVAATSEDWDTEYSLPIISVRLVEGLDAAVAHIATHSSGHTDAILTSDPAQAARFTHEVDSAIVMVNASTQFADGGEFGLGAEIGIATGRLHARGPVALEGLTTYKWIVEGNGTVRP